MLYHPLPVYREFPASSIKLFSVYHIKKKTSKGKFLLTKFVFGGSFGMSLERNCHDLEFTPDSEWLFTFGMNLVGVCSELDT
jgi:hypothetical protein